MLILNCVKVCLKSTLGFSYFLYIYTLNEYCELLRQFLQLLSGIHPTKTHSLHFRQFIPENIARVQNCPDVTMLNSLLGLCLFVFSVVFHVVFIFLIFLSFCLVVFSYFCRYVILSFYYVVFLSYCLFAFW